MEQVQDDGLGPEDPDQGPDSGNAGMGMREERPDLPPSAPGANKKEPDGPAGEEPIARHPQQENHPERRVRKRRSEGSEPDRVAKKIWAQLQRTYKEDIRVKVAKRDDQGSLAFVRGGVMEFNPNEEDPCDLERRVVEAYGVGTYRLTFLPPRGSSLQALNYSFTYMDARPEKEKPDSLQTSPADGSSNPEGAGPSGRLADLSPAAKLAAAGNGGGGDSRVQDQNGPLVGLVTRLLEATMDEQQKRFDRLNSSIEGLTKSLTERHPEPLPTQDVNKTIETVFGVSKGMVELARGQQPVTPPPPPPVQAGPSEFDKAIALATCLHKLNENKTQAGPPSPQANINENLVGLLVQGLNAENERLRKDAARSRGSLGEGVDTILKIAPLFQEGGLSLEKARELGGLLEGDEAEEEPSLLKSLLKGLSPFLGEFGKSFGAGLSAGIAKGLGDLAPGIAGSIFPPKHNNLQPPTSPPQPQPQPRGDVKGPAPVPPPTLPKNIKPFPMPPWTANPAPFQPRTPVGDPSVAHQLVEAQTATKTSTSMPADRVNKVANLLGHSGQPPVVHPEGAPTQRATLTDAEFGQLMATLQMPMPASHVAGIILAGLPEGSRRFLALPADEAEKAAESFLTPSQREAAQAILPRAREVFNAMKALVESRNRAQES